MTNRNLSILLLAVVAMTHYLYPILCEFIAPLHGQEKGVFYVLRGVEGAVLYGVLIRLQPKLWPVALWGAIEESETAVCRLSVGFPAPSVGSSGNGLCDDLTHWPLSMIGIAIAAVLVTRANVGKSE